MLPARGPVTEALLHSLPTGAVLCVAFSGGRDSTVLLHALARLRQARHFALRAVHVNHGLHASSAAWEGHAVAAAGQFDVTCTVLRVTVPGDGGHGIEAAARAVRYEALRQQLRAGDWLLTAHHADDQLETVLLHFLRGSGVSGLAGIPRDVPFGSGRLCRPLLDVPGEALQAYAAEVLGAEGISWLHDPMNDDPALDRGYLRHEVLPVLRRRFPAAARAAGRTAALAAEAAGLLGDLARADQVVVQSGAQLSLPALARLSPARQRNLIRHIARERGWAVPPERRLREGLGQLLQAAPCRQPVLRWSAHEIRRFRDRLYLLDAGAPVADEQRVAWPAGAALALGGARGELHVRRRTGAGLAPAIVAGGLDIVFRGGGERLRVGGDPHHRTLKYLFQAHGIVPWMRGHIPLVLAGGELVAVADLWIAGHAVAAPDESGFEIVWTGHLPVQ